MHHANQSAATVCAVEHEARRCFPLGQNGAACEAVHFGNRDTDECLLWRDPLRPTWGGPVRKSCSIPLPLRSAFRLVLTADFAVWKPFHSRTSAAPRGGENPRVDGNVLLPIFIN